MASEIDGTSALVQASINGYTSFGAGGFFGDSEKVWNESSSMGGSCMAVKVVRVSYLIDKHKASLYTGIPYMQVAGDTATGFPIKTGDTEEIGVEGKLSIDKNLDIDRISGMLNFARKMHVAAAGGPGPPLPDTEDTDLESIMFTVGLKVETGIDGRNV